MKVFLYLLCVTYVFGFSYRYTMEVEKVNGKYQMVCKFGDVQLPVGSDYQANDICAHCICRRIGLSCELLPGAARIIVSDSSDCISKTVDCKNRWVMRNNTNVDCPPNLIPEPRAMLGPQP